METANNLHILISIDCRVLFIRLVLSESYDLQFQCSWNQFEDFFLLNFRHTICDCVAHGLHLFICAFSLTHRHSDFIIICAEVFAMLAPSDCRDARDALYPKSIDCQFKRATLFYIHNGHKLLYYYENVWHMGWLASHCMYAKRQFAHFIRRFTFDLLWPNLVMIVIGCWITIKYIQKQIKLSKVFDLIWHSTCLSVSAPSTKHFCFLDFCF